MSTKVITPPTLMAAAEIRPHLRVTGTEEDALISMYVVAAHAYAELYTGRAIGEQTLELSLDTFPAGAVELRGPVINISSVTYTNATSMQPVGIASDQYYLDNYGPQCWALPVLNTSWPTTAAIANSVIVRYVAGDLPDGLKTALLLLTAHLYENREATSNSGSVSEISLGVRAFMDPYKVRKGFA